MGILMFLIGFLTGTVVVSALYFVLTKNVNSKTNLYFENIANKILKDSAVELTQQNKERLDEFFKRFKERIEDFEKRTEENFKAETENFTRFDMNIKSFLETGNRISQDTNSLVRAMKSDNRTSGRWGEIVLERVLEASGLRKDEEYTVQKGAAEGRPDAAVYLPENRTIFIDSKTSFASWDAYINAEDENEKQIHLKQFADSTKAHITGLSKRDYSAQDGSPDYVLMFIPVESCYSLMFCDDGALWDYAWRSRVMPVSPSTLLAALKIINSFHAVDRQNKNAKEISEVCTGMLDKFSDILKDLIKIKDSLTATFTKISGKGGILSKIDRISELGVKMNKDLPELPSEAAETVL
ncbi:MAG: DNA recombination protein RmuC [Heliobacteriaceae bacterium]|jgi:DNA recombination protein RmuC|nr:DNA recombination protein RmuC [Heliobacteriaceae bacterium]